MLLAAVQDGQSEDIRGAQWNGVREMLGNVSRSRSLQGFSPSETASFVLSLKRPLFSRIRREFSKDAEGLAEMTWSSTELLDNLALYTTEVHQKSREEVILRQQPHK